MDRYCLGILIPSLNESFTIEDVVKMFKPYSFSIVITGRSDQCHTRCCSL